MYITIIIIVINTSIDADDAIKYLDGYRLEDERLIVQVAKRSTRDLDRDRDYGRDRHRDNGSSAGGGGGDRCYNCGEFGMCYYYSFFFFMIY